jgi:hypothetical protein
MLYGTSNYTGPFPYPLLIVSATLSRAFSTLNYLSLSVLDHSRKDQIMIATNRIGSQIFWSNDKKMILELTSYVGRPSYSL